MTFHPKGDLTQQLHPMPRWILHSAWSLWSRGWQGIIPWLAAVCFAFATTTAASQGLAVTNKPFIVTAGGEPDTWGSRLGLLIYTAKPGLRMDRLEDLRATQYLVEYRRGLLLCENKKHAELAPRLATVLRQMKAQGLMETYQRQVERDLGWV